MPFLKFLFETLLLFAMLDAGIRDLSNLAIGLIVTRLFLSFISRILRAPGFLDEFEMLASGITMCALKIFFEAGIFFSLKEDINISMDFAIAILLLMFLRNVSDAWSLLAIELDES